MSYFPLFHGADIITTELISPQQDYRSWLLLAKTPGVGTKTFSRLVECFGSPELVLLASRTDLASCGLKNNTIEFLKNPDWALVDQDMLWAEQDRATILTLEHPAYPLLLLEIADPPPVLYVYGQLACLNDHPFAMVGSRNPSQSGTETAFSFARHLSGMGFTIVSGLALGIDAACHEGALAAQGATIAVTGTGLDRVYPAKHQELSHNIVEKGALVSEFPPGTAPVPGNFPRRNRIISGLSVGVLVIEAAQQSGSLITARLAVEQGREVFAVPGSIHHALAKGCNALIRQGAKLVETASHVLEEFPDLGSVTKKSFSDNNCGNNDTNGQSSSKIETGDTARELDSDYQKVLESVGFEPTSVDTVKIRSGLTTDAVCSMLLILELRGYIVPATGGGYSRT